MAVPGRCGAGQPVEGEVSQGQRRRLNARSPPAERPDPRAQLADHERLSEVVVRAAVERLHHIGLAVPAGEHQHGRRLAPLPHVLEDLEPGPLGQVVVQHDHVVVVHHGQGLPLVARWSHVHGVTILFHGQTDIFGQKTVIFDDEHLHPPASAQGWRDRTGIR
jgi:hypothetical protein